MTWLWVMFGVGIFTGWQAHRFWLRNLYSTMVKIKRQMRGARAGNRRH